MNEMKLTEEYKAQMLGLCSFSQKGTVDFTPSFFITLDIPEELKPIFVQRAYTKSERDEINELSNQSRKAIVSKNFEKLKQLSMKIDNLVRSTIMGWSQVYDLGSGDLVVYDSEDDKGVKAELFFDLTDSTRKELNQNALKISGMIPVESLGLESSQESKSE